MIACRGLIKSLIKLKAFTNKQYQLSHLIDSTQTEPYRFYLMIDF